MAGQKRQDSRLLAILAQAKGCSVAETARSSGVERRTILRWQKESEFRADVEKCRNEMLTATAGRLAAAALDAAAELQRLLKDDSPSIRLGAARSILDSTIRANELFRVIGRMDELETTIATLRRPIGLIGNHR